ncbi:MAG: XdhC family protein [Calothrix sp. SM1_7_51]|nr:XdhC family protein [Calothrix sp. SM1_7_51]
MVEFYQKLLIALKKSPVVLATITSTKGSVPREVGAKMFVYPDGRIEGTIGGGAGEGKVINQALQVFETGENQFIEIDLSGMPQRETQGVCGGTMLVWLELWAGEQAINLVNKVVNILFSGSAVAIVTSFDSSKKPYLETLNVPSLTLLQNNALIEPIFPPPTLLIIGAGHIAVPLAKIAHISGFKVIVQDDRDDFISPERFPDAAILWNKPIQSIHDTLHKFNDLYVTLLTRGYLQDVSALRVLYNRSVKYLGMVGSEKRVRTVYKMLEEEGCGTEFFHQIYAPIGLNIGAITPEEIAVSICGELIQVRRGGNGRSLSSKMFLNKVRS